MVETTEVALRTNVVVPAEFALQTYLWLANDRIAAASPRRATLGLRFAHGVVAGEFAVVRAALRVMRRAFAKQLAVRRCCTVER